MQFDLSENLGERFQFFRSELLEDGEPEYFDPEPDEPCHVTLRLADPDKVEEIHKLTRTPTTDWVLNPKTRGMERCKDFDQTPEQRKVERELIWDHAIVEWEGVLDKHGKVVECTIENKIRMMNVPVFSRFVSRCLQLISGEIAEKKEEQRKNS